ncbi:MAG: glycoside hydrolase family 127 protein [Planctomycetes bacterium]|nr:glycoside hydrolase family 127 protein [Planctomycetota bacterium]MBL7038851.1 glycoside hydrolase family 127 protein [Pirellulaceae bacterium]
MNRLVIGAIMLAGVCVFAEAGSADREGKLAPVPLAQVQIQDEFWAPRMKTCREVTLPYCFDVCEQTGRIRNFAKASGQMEGAFEGIWFNDSDVYKVLQGAAHELGVKADPKLDELTDAVIAKIAAAQQLDGYLYCFFTIDNADQRFKNIYPKARHELYCMGHMIEAGAVHHRITGKRNMLDVASKLADHIDSVFGPGKQMMVPEHQELELALIELYRVTGQTRYLKLAQFFIDQRGNAEGHKLYGSYSQDHAPVRQQSEIVGHAVRAMYNCIGMADLYLENGDEELLAALQRLWQSTTHRKMYVTGGVGATARGEAFGPDYDLPNATAYSETCAQIGLVLWAHRMLLIEPRAEYADVMERVLYNGFLSGLSLSGTEFFYQNRLASNGNYRRQPWYSCACCPSNVVRIYPQIGRFVYAFDGRSVYVNLYAAGKARLKVGGTDVSLMQETQYPWDGKVRLTIDPEQAASFDLYLRIPGWRRDAETPGGLYRTGKASDVAVAINGQTVEAPALERGYLRLKRKWQAGDTVALDLPMTIQRVRAHPKVAADRGRVALQRGPIVYCVEAVDHEAAVRRMFLPPDAELTAQHQPDLLGGVTVIRGKAAVRMVDSDERLLVDLLAIPYYAWDNRAGGAMAVWLAEDPEQAQRVPRPTIASRAKISVSHCNRSDEPAALNDQIEPPNSHDLSIPRHTWWNHLGTKEWVQYDLAEPATVDCVEVYWFDDRNTGRCLVPESWRLLYRDGETFKPVSGASPYAADVDKYNRVTFNPVTTNALRIEVQLRKGRSGGILEWRVGEAKTGAPD